MDIALSIWRLIVEVVNTAPPWLAASVLTWGITVGVTQTVRAFVPPAWPKLRRHALLSLVAILSALAVTQPLIGGAWGAAVGVCVGLWAVGMYYAAVKITCKRWPWLCERITWDKSA